MKALIKTVRVDKKTHKTISEEFKEVKIDHDPWDELCKILGDAFLESRKESVNQ